MLGRSVSMNSKPFSHTRAHKMVWVMSKAESKALKGRWTSEALNRDQRGVDRVQWYHL